MPRKEVTHEETETRRIRYLTFDIGIKNLSYTLVNVSSAKGKCPQKKKIQNKISQCDMHVILWKNIDVTQLGEENTETNTEEKMKTAKKLPKPKPMDFDDLCVKLCEYFDTLVVQLREENRIPDVILLENQPSLKNPRMKSIQMILATFFTVRLNIDHALCIPIHFVAPGSKASFCLKQKMIEKKPSKYSEMKKMSIQAIHSFLENENGFGIHMSFHTEEILEYWKGSKKKDDLGDVILLTLAHHSRL